MFNSGPVDGNQPTKDQYCDETTLSSSQNKSISAYEAHYRTANWLFNYFLNILQSDGLAFLTDAFYGTFPQSKIYGDKSNKIPLKESER